MLIHSKRQKPLLFMNIQLNGTPIEQGQSCKFLGVVVTDTLTWDDHIQFMCTKISKTHLVPFEESPMLLLGCLCSTPFYICRLSLDHLYPSTEQ